MRWQNWRLNPGEAGNYMLPLSEIGNKAGEIEKAQLRQCTCPSMACGGGRIFRFRLIQPGRASRRLYRQDQIAYGVQGESTPCAVTLIVATFHPQTP